MSIEKFAEVVEDMVKAEVTAYSAGVKNTVHSMIAEIEAKIAHIEQNLDNFAAHEKAAVQQWLLGLKNRVRSLLSRIV